MTNQEFIERLRCPSTGQKLFKVDEEGAEGPSGGWLISEDRAYKYPIIDGIPRFVPKSNYADNFGVQWNYFRKSQLDSHSGHPISSERFWKATGWKRNEIKGKWVLDVGCGAGRFAEVAVGAGANVVALDYSSAVDACYRNLGHHQNLYIVQGDIYALPFALETFDYVYSLGVLQHTPDVQKAFFALPPMLRAGGSLCVDYYWKRFRTMLHAKYLVRPFTKQMSQDRLFRWLERWVPTMLAVSRGLGGVPAIGRVLKRIVPVADYAGIYPLSEEQLKEWALLDTFDMLSPKYDNPQRAKVVGKWMRQSGLEDVEVLHAAHLVARGRKPR